MSRVVSVFLAMIIQSCFCPQVFFVKPHENQQKPEKNQGKPGENQRKTSPVLQLNSSPRQKQLDCLLPEATHIR